MRLKQLIFGLAIVSYAIALAHSILPHTHYGSHEKQANHHEQSKSSHDHEGKHDHHRDGGLTFPVHFSNADVSLSKFKSDFVVKVVKNQKQVHFTPVNDVLLYDEQFVCKAFHVPIDLQKPNRPEISSRSLRAPPSVS